ncbi:MAG: GNAT family N-acetyltransferase [Cellulomonas sp. 14-74-6]|jgi:RimJ/RimL family protein N-acetyltransferase|nr:MAG: GNAT family N-acetyltransferase [Cellulomonas sp. 14-74-6]
MDEDLTQLWPVAGLRVVSGDLELRWPDDDLMVTVAREAGRGIHAPDAMPFTIPWSRGDCTTVSRNVLQYLWGQRSALTVDSWCLELAVLVDGLPIGLQSARSARFPVTRTAETGSWLGQRHQGNGVGTRMRVLVLHLLFEGFGAREATSGAFLDNGPSNAVSTKLGYDRNGLVTVAREGVAAQQWRYRMDRERWDARPEWMRPVLTLHGVEPVREQLGIP